MKKFISILLTVFIFCTLISACTAPTSAPTTITTTPTTETQPVETTLGLDANAIPASILWQDVIYGDDSPSQSLDIYVPDTGEAPYPVIFAIHGGGFLGGDKAKATTALKMQLAGLAHGYAVVSINYRLSGEAVFPAAVSDAKSALRFIKHNAATYFLDPERIAVWGDSAGGNLAAMLGTTASVAELEDLSPGFKNQSSQVQAVVDLWGIINFLTAIEQSGMSNNPKSPESQYLGADAASVPDLVAKADPTTYISADDPPFFIMHGTSDKTVPPQQSIDFASALTSVIGADKVTLSIVEGIGHAGPKFAEKQYVDQVYAFLDKYLKAK